MKPVLTRRLKLVPQTREEVRAYINQMEAEARKTLSAAWLAMLERSSPVDPWIHGFVLVHQASGTVVGKCGFKGPPDANGVAEIAYGVDEEHHGKGYAMEAVEALVSYALAHGPVCLVRAHTLPEVNASTRVLSKCGFRRVGEVTDPEDGLVWRWEKP